MDKQQMLDILVELKNELDSNQITDSYQRQKTEALIDEINRQMTQPTTDMTGDKYLVEKLKSEIETIQVHHPQLTDLIGRLSDLLARMGI
ncbi:DUF4404 family protein [Aliikangiella maris]|uniref:DUF4404 family protein n=2 Tax=Aliikangiella maris TaxID=3162458 RepID=A0ABV2BQ55_9GAMM